MIGYGFGPGMPGWTSTIETVPASKTRRRSHGIVDPCPVTIDDRGSVTQHLKPVERLGQHRLVLAEREADQ